MIIGGQEYEGNLFSLFQSNVTTSDKLATYISSIFYPTASVETIQTPVKTCSSSASDSSPYHTGFFNELNPGFKLLASVVGDLLFTLTWRTFLQSALAAHPCMPAWSYLSSYDYGTPVLGTLDSSDMMQVFNGILPNYAAKSM
ncbi:hypothetical protein BGW36DRAFT_359138 [Talaromyces proteolyticus]|uniref:Uncharacterized protein n=1 Tax=Talaromyces proteolyticus TaxID=1131652 RepID=A0AAD4KV04_9EURO|nr:uncharacterized protein BGW36DRAFT_359138 [Talaromyces proteolyticus]KAH8697341.1 hypothetical protein BGW36DRAFT_359138 [Talaromyces proteolyticus]